MIPQARAQFNTQHRGEIEKIRDIAQILLVWESQLPHGFSTFCLVRGDYFNGFSHITHR